MPLLFQFMDNFGMGVMYMKMNHEMDWGFNRLVRLE